jgi:hypothetical protein
LFFCFVFCPVFISRSIFGHFRPFFALKTPKSGLKTPKNAFFGPKNSDFGPELLVFPLFPALGLRINQCLLRGRLPFGLPRQNLARFYSKLGVF